MKFIGVDLGWTSGATGLCCLQLVGSNLELASLTTHTPLPEVWQWFDQQILPTEPGLVAVDAPTLIPNATGSRLCDRLAHKHFGRYHAGAYPANQGLPFAQQTTSFGDRLTELGFAHAPTIEPQQPGRYQIELFPHPATIQLFGLSRILKYKKGKLRDRKLALAQLHQHITTVLPTLVPALALPIPLPSDYSALTSKQLKAIEDQLDSLLCAYVGAHWWWWGTARNWVLGDAQTGYIVVPAPPGTPSTSHA
ncbi:MAG: DUF429 domain-containing protein [Spirulina sp. SIO3F2]|nr:DUF429 domain-containing protein [Spirulina sp. SIO3F2]